jgi:protein JSN1
VRAPNLSFFFFLVADLVVFRARESQGDGLTGRYRPPALRALASGGSPPNDPLPSITTSGDGSSLPPTNYPPGFRRARAGTLPSNVQLAAQRFAASSTASADSLLDQSQRQATIAPIPSLPAPARPVLRHSSTTVTPPLAPPSTSSTSSTTTSTTTAATTTERQSRLRSGSLTLLGGGGLSNAFGPSIFSSSWLSNSNSNGGGGNGYSVLDELRSASSTDLSDDFKVPTLDYLGLDDNHRPPPAATLSELRNQAQAAIAGNLANPSRMRANTVSNPYRSRTSASGSLLSTPAAEEEEDYFVDGYDSISYDRQQIYDIPTGDFGPSNYLNSGFKSDNLAANRPRAISVGILDDPMRSVQRRAPSSDALSYSNELSYSSANISLTNNISNTSGILKTDKLSSARPGVSPTVHFPNGSDIPVGRGASAYLLAPSGQNRSVSPKSEGPSSQLQTPTRSLWIGNLDSAVTSEQLIHVFAPYGAIESLRLLPEKVKFSQILS